jgi:hypothetical protein
MTALEAIIRTPLAVSHDFRLVPISTEHRFSPSYDHLQS